MNAWQRFRARPGAVAGLVALAALGLLAILADLCAADLPLAVRVDGHTYLAPCLLRPPALLDDDQQSLARRAEWMVGTPIPYGPLASHPGGVDAPLSPPSRQHLVGTDDRGRDVAARLLHGTRTALAVGLFAAATFLAIGLLLGCACGIGRGTDLVVARLIEVGSVVPAYFLLLAVQAAAAGARAASVMEVALAIALTRWPEVARVTRAEVLRVKRAPHVEAARALGLSDAQVALRHVLPLAAGPGLVAAALGVGQAVLLEAGLSFLGFGVAAPTPSWGGLLSAASGAGLPAHLIVAPALAIAVTVLSAGRVAEGLQAVLDPRS